jgi:AICAR transformylase/IMP cyclohydrolase PurH
MDLRYGTNPHQSARATPVSASSPIRVVNGQPSYINLLDILNGWQLVREAGRALNAPAAASFKHVSPAGAAIAGDVDDVAAACFRRSHGDMSPVTTAYVRARDADPKSSYGDLAAVSASVDADLADLLAGVVCDGIVAPGFEPGVVATLSRKRNGRFLVIEADDQVEPPLEETRELLGIRLTQQRDATPLTQNLLIEASSELAQTNRSDLLLGLVVLRYTQSNSVAYLRDGMTVGIGAGQQSRVDCTRLAGAKVDTWWLRRHPMVRDLQFAANVRRQDRINWQIRVIEGDLSAAERDQMGTAFVEPPADLTAEQRRTWVSQLSDVAFVSDGHLPFRDNVDQASRHGVSCIAEPGGSIRSRDVEQACSEHGILLAQTALRLFHH